MSTTATTTPQAPPSPGSWQHPRAAEISRRRRANTFTETNLHRLLYNSLALAGLIYFYIHNPITITKASTIHTVTTLLLFLAGILLSYNIVFAVAPLLRAPDSLADIPLTPTQRALYGLPPSSSPSSSPFPLDSSNYITPPRYSPRTSNNTPLSSGRRESPRTDRGDSPVHSPLWGKGREMQRRGIGGGNSVRSMVGGGGEGRKGLLELARRDSFGSGSGRSSSVGLSSKWLYEQERRRGSGGYS